MCALTLVFVIVGPTPLVVAQPETKIILSSTNPQFSGEFGYSVATNGGLVVVGAPDESVGVYTDAGNAYVFNATTGHLRTALRDPNSQYYGEFGYSVALVGSEAVIGGDGNTYTYDALTGALIATLSSPNSQDLAVGGYVIASGRVDVVGEPLENVSNDEFAGSAIVSNASSGAVLATLTSPNSQADGGFGYAVATSGSLVVADAPGETVGGNASAGRAYLFNAETGSLVSTLTSPESQYYGNFGYSAAISGNTLVVGAPGEAVDGYTFAGRAYVFNAAPLTSSGSTSSWSRQESIRFVAGLAAVGAIAIAVWVLIFVPVRKRRQLGTGETA